VSSIPHSDAGPPAGGLKIGVGLYTGQGSTADVHGYRDAIVLARAAEEAGFDSFWVSESHGWDDAYQSSRSSCWLRWPLSSIGSNSASGLVLAPLYHPVRLACDVAVLDQLFCGRLILGLGYLDQEYATFGVERSSRAARLVDVIEVLRLARTGMPFSYAGRSAALSNGGSRRSSDALVVFLSGWAPIPMKLSVEQASRPMGI
jgi:alkanesulfonate monooxygenase SsuD/methylene tetrahydromethanopterin reductase-like flavin-dependent oxidoreductase (luciferase family)